MLPEKPQKIAHNTTILRNSYILTRTNESLQHGFFSKGLSGNLSAKILSKVAQTCNIPLDELDTGRKINAGITATLTQGTQK